MSSFGGEVKIGKDLNPEISGIEDKSSHSLDITDAEIKKISIMLISMIIIISKKKKMI